MTKSALLKREYQIPLPIPKGLGRGICLYQPRESKDLSNPRAEGKVFTSCVANSTSNRRSLRRGFRLDESSRKRTLRHPAPPAESLPN